MNHIDNIISALYLAKSDNREKMLSDLILNVLYTTNKYLHLDELVEIIKNNFHLEPIKYELETALGSLVETGDIFIANSKYCLSGKSKESIHQAIVKEKDSEESRKNKFCIIINEYFKDSVDEIETELIWEVYNNYLLECFLEFGRKAINIFVPYEEDTLSADNNIYARAYEKLKKDKLISIFKELVVKYPERLSESDLTYLTGLADKAEKFYSLGIEKSEYEKIQNMQLKDMCVVLDTNILYSLLNLRTHPEKSAIFEIVNLIKTGSIDIKLIYLPKTFSELLKVKNYLEKIISKDNFNTHQINALLASEKLDSFARQYYTEKLSNSNFPHPSERISYAKDYLQALKIIIHNHKFIEFEAEDFLANRVSEYEEFERSSNSFRKERGLGGFLHKDLHKVEHDVCLREAVKILKSKNSTENDLNFICLTLDNSLIHFDQYKLRKENEGLIKSINPNFIMPSIFLKKIRPFIPIVTNDYRKAFVTSLTSISVSNDDEKNSVLVQKSMSYFKNMGIDDEEIIISCIKRELFLEEFEEHEKDNTVDGFIKSEVGKEIEHLKADKHTIEKSLEDLKAKSQKEIEQIINSKLDIEQRKNAELQRLQTNIKEKEGEIDGMSERLLQIEIQLKREKDQTQYEKEIKDWEDKQNQFAGEKLTNTLALNEKDFKYILFVIFITALPITAAIIIKVFGENFITWIENEGISQWVLWGILGLTQIFEIFGRSYIFNKEQIKNGWKMLGNFLSKKKEGMYLDREIQRYKTEYELSNKKPKAPNIKAIREEEIKEERNIA